MRTPAVEPSLPVRSFSQADRFLDARAVQRRVVYSLQHITRLEHSRLFPSRRVLGAARVAWSEREVIDWMQTKLDARGPCPFCRYDLPLLGKDDRFLSKKEVSAIVLYSVRHLQHLETRAEFPARIRIGANRVAWLERDITHWMTTRIPT